MTASLMRRLILEGITGVWLSVLPIPAGAQVDIRVGIQLPPLVFSAPPQVVVLPETYVYVVPDIDEDVFFLASKQECYRARPVFHCIKSISNEIFYHPFEQFSIDAGTDLFARFDSHTNILFPNRISPRRQSLLKILNNRSNHLIQIFFFQTRLRTDF